MIFLLQPLPPLLPNYKSPCWYEEVPDNFRYENNYYNQYACLGENPQKTYKKLIQMLEDRCHEADHTCWRIRCCPYFFFLGSSKTGTSSLFLALTNYLPELEDIGMGKESQYWPRRRFGVEFCAGKMHYLYKVNLCYKREMSSHYPFLVYVEWSQALKQ